ncbi:MAG: hypothetical protein KQA41_00395 [Candidatus Aenigmarchaeota archaeon]|nr:hypothetical protein [Candidatus Aenigmarchaeota archaeon]
MRFLYVILIFIIALSGCVEQTIFSNQLSVDVNYPKKVLPSYDFSVEVEITNNFNKDIKNVNVGFENLGLLNFKKIEECDGYIHGKSCFFNTLYSGESKKVTFLVQMPESTYIYRSSKINAQISVTFDFEDQKILTLPILGKEYKGEKIMREDNTNGPLRVNLNINLGENERSYVKSGDIFILSVDFPNSENIVIEKNNFSIKLNGFKVYENDKNCDFEGYNILKPKNDIELPLNSPLICVIRADILKDQTSWIDGKIIVDYKYNYKIEKNLIIND